MEGWTIIEDNVSKRQTLKGGNNKGRGKQRPESENSSAAGDLARGEDM